GRGDDGFGSLCQGGIHLRAQLARPGPSGNLGVPRFDPPMTTWLWSGVMAGLTPSAPPRLLRRSREDRVIAGVCGGLGRYLGVDPILLRVALVVLAIGGGVGFLIYGVAWLVIPKEAPGEQLGM